MDLLPLEYFWGADTTSGFTLPLNDDDFYGQWGMDSSFWVMSEPASSSTFPMFASATPPMQAADASCDTTEASQPMADEDVGRGTHTVPHCSQDALRLPDEHVARASFDDGTEAEVAKRETNHDALQDLSPAVPERESTKSGAAGSSLDAVDDAVLGPSERLIAADLAPCRLPGKGTDQHESGNKTRSDGSSDQENGFGVVSINSPDQECVIEDLAEARETTATSGDGAHGPTDNPIVSDTMCESRNQPPSKVVTTGTKVDGCVDGDQSADKCLRRTVRPTRKRRSDDTQLWGEPEFGAKKLEELNQAWATLQPDLLFEFADLMRTFESSGNQMADLTEDFLESITSLYSMLEELQANNSAKPARAVHTIAPMLISIGSVLVYGFTLAKKRALYSSSGTFWSLCMSSTID